jgi:uncharacterized protein (TIGR02301 family)
MRRLMAILGVGLALICAATAAAQIPPARGPAERQALVDLAYVLGQSHALRQACAGVRDQHWRQRMETLVATEQPDPAFSRRLAESFNTGFAATLSAYPRCGARSRRAEAAAAARGEALATSLTAPVAEDDPTR